MSKPGEPPAYPSYPPYGGATTFPGQQPPPPQYPQTYPPGPGYPNVVTVVPGTVFREHPVSTVCPHCNSAIVTQVQFDTGVLPWLVCGGLFLVGCSLGCCLIPFCIDGLKDALHTCPQCRKVVGQYKRM